MQNVKIIVFIFISQFTLANCLNGVLQTPNKEISTLTDLTVLSCIEKYQNFEFDSTDDACECTKSYDTGESRPSKNSYSRTYPEDKAYNEAGKILKGKIFEFSNILLGLDDVNQLSGTNIGHQCNLLEVTTKISCLGDFSKAKKLFAPLMEKMDEVYLEKEEYKGPESIRKRLEDYFMAVAQGEYQKGEGSQNNCIAPNLNSKLAKRRIKLELESRELNNSENPIVNLIRESISSHPDFASQLESQSLNEILKNHDIQKSIGQKIDSLCTNLAKELEGVACTDDYSGGFDIDKDEFFESVSIAEDAATEKDSIEVIKQMNSICKPQSFKIKSKPIANFWDEKFKIPSPVAYEANHYSAALEASTQLEKYGVCGVICENPNPPYAVGGCQRKDVNKQYAELNCDSILNDVTNTDVASIESCRYLKLFQTLEVSDEIDAILASDIKEESSSGTRENKRINSPTNRKSNFASSLLGKFLAKKPSSKVSRPQQIATMTDDSATKTNRTKEKTETVAANPPSQIQGNLAMKVEKKSRPSNISEAQVNSSLRMRNSGRRIQNDNSSDERVRVASGVTSSRSSSRDFNNPFMKKSDGIDVANDKLQDLMSKLGQMESENKKFESLANNMKRKKLSEALPTRGSRRIAPLGSYDEYGVAVNPENSIGNPPPLPRGNSFSNREEEGITSRTDLLGDDATGITSPEDGDVSMQASLGRGGKVPGTLGSSSARSRSPASLKRGSSESGDSSAISKLFQGKIAGNSVAPVDKDNLVEVKIPDRVKEVNLAEVLKNRNEIKPGEPFVLYEVQRGRKIKVTLIPTFSKLGRRRIFTGYRPLKVNSRNKFLVDKLKAQKNLFVQI